ncbi:MAG: nucleotidyltransferase domain-containing protein [Deltaproteobacteria bacterium]|nr:nucleotidyltransferase domain-containing protein [Deltaproteobacteria bacterium]
MTLAVREADLQIRYDVVVQALREAFGARLKTVVLFGSQARGQASVDSDHDLLVVVEGLPTDPLKRQREARAPLLSILDRTPGAIAFVAKTPSEVDANLTPLLLDVCADGVSLYGAEYFEPYRRKALAALRQAGMDRKKIGQAWMWTLPCGPSGDWELTWDGYRERA